MAYALHALQVGDCADFMVSAPHSPNNGRGNICALPPQGPAGGKPVLYGTSKHLGVIVGGVQAPVALQLLRAHINHPGLTQSVRV